MKSSGGSYGFDPAEEGSQRQGSMSQWRNLNPGPARLKSLPSAAFLFGVSGRKLKLMVDSPLSGQGVGCINGRDTHPLCCQQEHASSQSGALSLDRPSPSPSLRNLSLS